MLIDHTAVVALVLEVPELTDYVMDIAMGQDFKPLVVELNPLLNSGLNAWQPVKATEAMAARAGVAAA